MGEGQRQMRYKRGVKLTEEERAGGGEGAGRGWQPDMSNQFAAPGGYGFNPQAGGGGGYDYGAPAGGAGASAQQQALLQALMQIWSRQATPTTPEEYFSAKAQARDPVGWRAKQKDVASMGPTFDEAFAGRRAADLYTPAEILASQGNTAENQIISRRAAGAKGPSGIDPGRVAAN